MAKDKITAIFSVLRKLKTEDLGLKTMQQGTPYQTVTTGMLSMIFHAPLFR
jgi:hypothetical protein